MNPTFNIIIPARLDSKRLPGKPLRDLCGKPLIQRVYERAQESSALSITIATGDVSILDAAQSFGANVCMTSQEHQSGTDRVSEAVEKLGLHSDDIVINLQGDEPCMPGSVIDQVAAALDRTKSASLATACYRIESEAEYYSRDVVKVVRDEENFALYFSRAPIPFSDKLFLGLGDAQIFRHIGLYAYRVGALKRLAAREPTVLERLEQLEQLRALWHRELIIVCEAEVAPGAGVDTLADLERASRYFS